MTNLRKRAGFILAFSLFAMIFAGCETHSSLSYTFKVETGDNIKVTLDTSDDWSLSQEEGRFGAEYDGETVLQGIFVTKDMYEQYLENVHGSDASILVEDEKDGNTYLFYKYEGEAGTETNFILWVKDSNTGIVMGSLSGAEKAQEAFERISFEKES